MCTFLARQKKHQQMLRLCNVHIIRTLKTRAVIRTSIALTTGVFMCFLNTFRNINQNTLNILQTTCTNTVAGLETGAAAAQTG